MQVVTLASVYTAPGPPRTAARRSYKQSLAPGGRTQPELAVYTTFMAITNIVHLPRMCKGRVKIAYGDFV